MSFVSDNMCLITNPEGLPFVVVRGQTSATANKLTAVRLDGEFRRVAIQFLTNTGRIAAAASDDENTELSVTIGAADSDFWTLPADTAMDVNLAMGRATLPPGYTFYITSATTATEYQIIAEQAGV